MAIQNYAQSWTDTYEKYQSVVNFVAGDFQVGKTKYSDHYPIKCTIYRAEKHS